MIDSRHPARQRQALAEISLWVLLAATIGLAAIVDRGLRKNLFLTLTEPISEGQVSFSLPADWKVTSHPGDGDAHIHTVVDPTGSGGGNCTITVVSQHVDMQMTPAEYLHFSGQLAGKIAEMPSETMLVDDWPGEWIPWVSRKPGSNETGDGHGILFAVVLPTRQAVSISLDRNGALDQRDIRLFKQLVDSIRVSMRPGFGPIELADGTQITVPQDFIVYEQPDPLCEARMVVQRPGKGGWISAQFVGLVTKTPPSAVLLTALASREHLDFRDPLSAERWLRARIDQEAPNRWRIDPQDPADRLIHRRAYLLTGNRGGGLAVIFTAISPDGDAEMDSAWAELAGGIHLADGVNLDAIIDAGAKVAPVATHAPPQISEAQWWLWSSNRNPTGWTRTAVGHDGITERQTVRRNWEGTATKVLERWDYSDNPPGALARMTRFDAESEKGSSFEFSFDVATGVADTLITRINLGEQSFNPIAITAPRGFVLSSRFPGFLGNLPEGKIALWTDRFPGADDELLASPILVVASRGQPDDSGQRCEEVRFNGTGRVSRWYFRDDGTFDHADFGGQRSLEPSNPAEIQSAVAGDARLTLPQP